MLKVEATADAISQASSKIISPRALLEVGDVEQALYRKKISDKYHTSLPKFLRSQGPFAVDDHAAIKGSNTFDTVGRVNEQALDRFKSDIDNVQKMRETEKAQFYNAIDYMDRMEAIK